MTRSGNPDENVHVFNAWTTCLSFIKSAMLRSLLSFALLTSVLSGQTPDPAATEAHALKRLGESPVPKDRGPFPDGKFVLGERETIVMLGGETLRQAGADGVGEAAVAQTYAALSPRFRWMAVAGDTVYVQGREMNFGPWPAQLQGCGATMVVCQFGRMESTDGPARLPEFTAAYHRLLDQLMTVTSRIVLLPPRPFEKWNLGVIGDHAPDPAVLNEKLRAYAAAVVQIARDRKLIAADSPDFAAAMLAKVGEAADGELLAAIVEKNRLWSSCWRPANWPFAYGDRVWAEFGKPGGGAPFLKEEYAQLLPIVFAHENFISARVNHQPLPILPPPVPHPSDAFPALTPAEEQATFKVAPGYDVQLFADESQGVIKPTQIAWDARGRLFVACTPGYPQLSPGQKPEDYVLVCEDTDHDGRAEVTWKYAENLTMTQGLEPGDGGLYVCDYDKIVHYASPKGRTVSTNRHVILSGFGIGDTHQLVNSISHGDDGTLWFSQGLHNLSRVETPFGVSILEKSGIWRLDPRTLRLDSFFNGAKAGHNCWGVAYDDFGQVFHKSGDRPDGYWCVPGMVRAGDPDEYHGIGNMFQTNPKTTALDFIGTTAMPDELQGCAVLAGFMGGVVEVHRMVDNASGFKTEQLPRLLESTSDTFRPVDVSVGPDGAIYVCDFYNPIIGHYQNSYRDPKRDKSHGRIWRISAKNRPSVEVPQLVGMPTELLIKQLDSPQRWTRLMAKRVLATLPEAKVIAAAQPYVDAPQSSEPFLRELLGVYLAQHHPHPDLLRKLLKATDARVRAYATRAIGTWAETLPDAAALLGASLKDAHPRVRLEAIVAASYMASDNVADLVLAAFQQPRDQFIDYALAQSLRAMKSFWHQRFDAGQFAANESPEAKALLTKIRQATPEAASVGKVLFETLCMNCHQSDAKGLPGFYPPLAGSDWINGDPSRLGRILLHGLTGPITVNGQPFAQNIPIPMPPSGLTDEQIATVLTYIRSNFGNQSAAIDAASVKALREANASRVELWTEADLAK